VYFLWVLGLAMDPSFPAADAWIKEIAAVSLAVATILTIFGIATRWTFIPWFITMMMPKIKEVIDEQLDLKLAPLLKEHSTNGGIHRSIYGKITPDTTTKDIAVSTLEKLEQLDRLNAILPALERLAQQEGGGPQ
jgi:uncharacterized membrane protein